MCEGEGWRARFAASGQRDAENHKIMKRGGTEPARGEGGGGTSLVPRDSIEGAIGLVNVHGAWAPEGWHNCEKTQQ